MPSMLKEVRGNNSSPQGIKKFAEVVLTNIVVVYDTIIEAWVFQIQQANKHRLPKPDIKVNNLVYLVIKNLNLPKERSSKLCPKYIGPFTIVEVRPKFSNYCLELLPALIKHKIHPMFHVLLLRLYTVSNDVLFLNQAKPEPYDFGIDDEHEWFIDELTGHRFNGHKNLKFEVHWNTSDMTWELYNACKDLMALDRYLELRGVSKVTQLP
ncbi:hypothetical protein AN958_12416 [Leucoagaricus sp. SymC.cos]|nr:hypothetical protein AN958_12416 [Leucoagaricus sp. SymC.cos]